MLERMETPVLVCEWDGETGEGTVVVGVPGPAAQARELEWKVVQELHDVLFQSGLEWSDEEWRERFDLTCVPWAGDGQVEVALLWRTRFKRESDVAALAAAVRHGLGLPDVRRPPRELEQCVEQLRSGEWPSRPPGSGTVRWVARRGDSLVPPEGRDGDVVVFP